MTQRSLHDVSFLPTLLRRRPAAVICCVAFAIGSALGCSDDDPGAESDTGTVADVGEDGTTPDASDAVGDVTNDADSAGDANDATDAPDANDAPDATDTDDGGADATDTTDTAGDATGDTAGDGADGASEPSADTCDTAIDVSAGGTWADQSTVGAANDYDAELGDPNCPNGSFSGNDRVYVATPTATTEYKVTVVPQGSFDPFLYVRASCTDQACMAGTVLNGAGESETVTFELQAGETGHIIVDGELGDSGDYTLTVEIL